MDYIIVTRHRTSHQVWVYGPYFSKEDAKRELDGWVARDLLPVKEYATAVQRLRSGGTLT